MASQKRALFVSSSYEVHKTNAYWQTMPAHMFHPKQKRISVKFGIMRAKRSLLNVVGRISLRFVSGHGRRHPIYTMLMLDFPKERLFVQTICARHTQIHYITSLRSMTFVWNVLRYGVYFTTYRVTYFMLLCSAIPVLLTALINCILGL
jgi:hypothetical protein